MAVKSPREKAEEQRRAKLDHVRERVEDGSLVIRQMTPEERLRFPARPPRPPRTRPR